MMQVKEVCIRFTKMIIAVLFLAYLNLLNWSIAMTSPVEFSTGEFRAK